MMPWTWADAGKAVVLARKETVPDDIHGMHVAKGVLTATGGMTSHAAVVGRQMGKPSVVGAGELEIDEEARTIRVGGRLVREGDFVSFDGLSGEVKLGQVETKPSEILQVLDGKLDPKRSDIYRRFSKLLGWADKIRRLGIPGKCRPSGSGQSSICLRCSWESDSVVRNTCSSVITVCRSCSV